MSQQLSLHYENDYSHHYEISIRNEYTRFACMFYLFTLLAFLTTLFLFLSANNSYHDQSESIQRRFIPYTVLGLISLSLFFIFFFGSIVYTNKLIRKLRLKSSLNLPSTTSNETDNSNRSTKFKTLQSFIMNTDESYYTSTKPPSAEKNSRTKNLSSRFPCQTDV